MTLRDQILDNFSDHDNFGEHKCEGRAKVATAPPKHALRAPASMPFFKPHPCCLTYFLATAQESKQRKPLATKVLNRTKKAYLSVVSNVFPPTSTQMTSLSFAPKINLFVLKL